MAIDSQEKRMGAAGAGRPWMRSKLPGANDEAWRLASGLAYGGNALTADTMSANERRSIVNMASPWRGMLPLPDGTFDSADRQQLGFMYAGVAYAAPTANASYYFYKYVLSRR